MTKSVASNGKCALHGPFRFHASETDLRSKVFQSLEDNGIAVVENYITNEHADAIKKDLTAKLDRVPTGRTAFEGYKTRRLYAMFAKTRCIDVLVTDPFVLDVMESFLRHKEILLCAPIAIEIRKGENPQMAHRDEEIYNFIPRPHGEVVMNCMWAIDDFTSMNGSTVVYPGSHKMSEDQIASLKKRIAEGKAEDEAMSGTMPKGSVMFFRGSTLHGGGRNETDHPRLGVVLEFNAGWLRPQENHTLAVPPEIAKNLPRRLQELLGYSVAQPFLGYVDGRDPRNYFFGHNEKFFKSNL